MTRPFSTKFSNASRSILPFLDPNFFDFTHPLVTRNVTYEWALSLLQVKRANEEMWEGEGEGVTGGVSIDCKWRRRDCTTWRTSATCQQILTLDIECVQVLEYHNTAAKKKFVFISKHIEQNQWGITIDFPTNDVIVRVQYWVLRVAFHARCPRVRCTGYLSCT